MQEPTSWDLGLGEEAPTPPGCGREGLPPPQGPLGLTLKDPRPLLAGVQAKRGLTWVRRLELPRR